VKLRRLLLPTKNKLLLLRIEREKEKMKREIACHSEGIRKKKCGEQKLSISRYVDDHFQDGVLMSTYNGKSV
jgi:hypothetical protein